MNIKSLLNSNFPISFPGWVVDGYISVRDYFVLRLFFIRIMLIVIIFIVVFNYWILLIFAHLT